MTVAHLEQAASAAAEMLSVARLAQRDDGVRLYPYYLVVRPGELHQPGNKPPRDHDRGNAAVGGVKFALYRATPFVMRNSSIWPL